jgi:dipeptidyl aminopeptidase/acylaminoacyl peptidase
MPPTDVYRKNAATPHAWLESLAWAPDGKQFAFCAVFDAHPAEIVIGTKKDGAWSTTYAKRQGRKDAPAVHIRGYGTPLKWDRDVLIALGETQGNVGIIRFYPSKDGSMTSSIAEDHVIYGFDFDTFNSKMVVIRGDTTGFPELYSGNNGQGKEPLTNINPHVKSWKMPTVRHITWKGADNATVGGILELPHGYRKGQKLPLVVAIHGGPTTASYVDQRFDPHNGRLYFTTKGFAVLLPNYRGSTGYGDQFVTDLIGNENDIDVRDILTGIQHLVKEGIADPDRVGCMGWSNGGYLTNCLITLKNPPIKFRAASSGAGILDCVAEWGFNDEPAYPMVFKKGLPWESADIYKKTSPVYGLGNVTTPTLIHVGGNDERCPPGHSRMLYRALKEYKKVPTELVVYTGEPHGLGKLTNRKAKMEWDLAWFEKYILKDAP